MSGFYDATVDGLRRIYDRRLSGPPVLDLNADFPSANRFVERWSALRDEALGLAQDINRIPRFHELMPAQAEISANDARDWRMHVVRAYGVTLRRNMARCPELASILARTPEVLSATLSFLAPHKHIPCHRGPFRGILRFQLGLSVPLDADGRPAAVLKLHDTEQRIGDGQCLLWDDTFPHEVWNHSDEPRIALLLDVRRPHMPWDLALLSRLIVAAVGTSIRLGAVPQTG